MELVFLESPYAGNVSRNVTYARLCMRDCIFRSEAPFASHLLYTQPDVLDDSRPQERELGIQAGFAWAERCTKSVFYTDFGISSGMMKGIETAAFYRRLVEFRKLPQDVFTRFFYEENGEFLEKKLSVL
jgi:hypothetical protein